MLGFLAKTLENDKDIPENKIANLMSKSDSF
jgi:hypothetical protein